MTQASLRLETHPTSIETTVADKATLLAELLDRIRDDLATLIRTQEETRAAATHDENRAEHAKDTRATEQSYLARGLAERVEDLRRSETLLAELELRSFDTDDPIETSAIVRIGDEQTEMNQIWFLVPAGAGIKLSFHGASIQTITPAAPLGRALMGLHVGDEGRFQTPRGERHFEILSVR